MGARVILLYRRQRRVGFHQRRRGAVRDVDRRIHKSADRWIGVVSAILGIIGGTIFGAVLGTVGGLVCAALKSQKV